MFHCVGMIKLLVTKSISGPSSCPRGQGWGQRFHPVNLMSASSNHQPHPRVIWGDFQKSPRSRKLVWLKGARDGRQKALLISSPCSRFRNRG